MTRQIPVNPVERREEQNADSRRGRVPLCCRGVEGKRHEDRHAHGADQCDGVGEAKARKGVMPAEARQHADREKQKDRERGGRGVGHRELQRAEGEDEHPGRDDELGRGSGVGRGGIVARHGRVPAGSGARPC